MAVAKWQKSHKHMLSMQLRTVFNLALANGGLPSPFWQWRVAEPLQATCVLKNETACQRCYRTAWLL